MAFERIKRSWRRLKQSEPGRRFQDRYERNRAPDSPRLARVGGALVLALLGLVMLVTPGPGLAALGVGLALLAGEFRAVARFLDWTELRLRKLTA